MYVCCTCQGQLARLRVEQGMLWQCRNCDAHFVGLGLLKRIYDSSFTVALIKQKGVSATNPRSCPACRKPMESVPRPEESDTVDLCRPCFSVWFDRGEFLGMVEGKVKKARTASPAETALAKALIEKESREADENDPAPDASWKMIFAVFGLPVETRSRTLGNTPWATRTVGVLLFLTALWTFPRMESIFEAWAFFPTHPLRHFGLTPLASFFLHGGWMHLLGNLYFLLVFGDDVEDFLGRARYLLLILVATYFGDGLELIFTPSSDIPHIGASGGIFGIITFYCFSFPRARLTYWLWFNYLEVPAWIGLGLMILYQFVGAHYQLSGFGDVSYLAHLGGGIAGLLFHLLYRTRNQYGGSRTRRVG